MAPRPNTRNHFTVHNEFSYENLLLLDRKSGIFVENYLDRPRLNNTGICMGISCSDTLNHRMKLFELTCHPSKSRFFDQKFGDSYSTEHIVSHKFSHIDTLFTHVNIHGVTSTRRYEEAPVDTNSQKILTGCPKLKIDGWECVPKEKNWSSQIEKHDKELKWAAAVTHEIMHHGPMVAYFNCYKDFSSFATDFLYEPCKKEKAKGYMISFVPKKHFVSHSVMLIGSGEATDLETFQRKHYFICLHNWGNLGNPIGRMPIEYFEDVYYPKLNDQTSFINYMTHQSSAEAADQKHWLLMK